MVVLIVGVNIISILIVFSGKFLGYDKILMLLMYEKVFIIIVIVFFVFVCMINIFFYILIVYNIYFMLNVENKIGNRMYFSVYIKLFFIIGLFLLL